MIAALVAYLVFIGGGWSGIYMPAIRLTSVILAGLVLAIWAVLFLRRPSLRPRSNLMPAIAASLGSFAISTMFSRFPGVSLEYLGYAIVLASLYLLLVQLMRDEFFRRRFMATAGVLFVVVVAADVVLVLSHWVQWWEALGRITVPPLRPEYEGLTFGGPSGVLMVVALLAVPIVGTVEWTTRRGVLIVAAVLLSVAVVGLLSGSRAGWLALAVTAASGALAMALSRDARSSVRAFLATLATSRLARIGLGAGLIALGGLALVLVPTVVHRASEGGEVNRLVFVQVALRLFAESPVVGTGPGTWVIQRVAETKAGEIDEYIPFAHNLYAQTLAELGLAGAAAGLVLIGTIAVLLVRAMRSHDGRQRQWAVVTALGIVYFAAHQTLDFYSNSPAVLFLFALPLACLDATSEQSARAAERPPERGRGRVGYLLAAGVVAISIAGLALQEIPALRMQALVERANAGDWAGLEAPAREAAAEDPRISPYLFTAGLAAAREGDHLAAIQYFKTVAERDDLPEAWLNLAAEELVAGDRSTVGSWIQAALRLGSQRSSILIAAGELALRAGSRELGIATLATAVAGRPSFLQDPWWTTNGAVSGLRQEIAIRAAAVAPGAAWEIALMSGDHAKARALVAVPGGDIAQLGFIDAWAGDVAARGRLFERCLANPFDTQGLGWCARLATHLGDAALAARFRDLIGTLNVGMSRLATDVRVIESSPGSIDTNLAVWWAPFTYRRFAPWDMLVPSLVHLTQI